MINRLILVVAAFATSSCMMRSQFDTTVTPMAENYRPQFHFSPASNWTNDPNGLFWAAGKYHLFFQHNPDKAVWGPMHWGHAVSRDLIHWEQQPIALSPDSLGYIFSGSAVYDNQNTSGLGTETNPPIVLIYTYHDMPRERAGHSDYQSQGLAYSVDGGVTWVKYKANPILANPGSTRDFRDPKIVWDNTYQQWVMSLAVKDHVEFYVSSNLLGWKKSGEFGRTAGAHGGVWECPDLIRIITRDGQEKFVLLVSINPGAPNGGSGTQYFVGSFDGKTFHNDDKDNNRGWVDYGTDNYAGVTYANVPDGRIISIGWMSNWQYAQEVPTTMWRNAMTVPRELQLQQIGGREYLVSIPVKELEILRTEKIQKNTRVLTSAAKFKLPSDKVELLADIEGITQGQSFSFTLSNQKGDSLIIGLDSLNQFYIDRRKSGITSFNSNFGAVHFAPRISVSSTVRLRILIDTSSIELFADDGATVMTDIIFPSDPYDSAVVITSDTNIKISNSFVLPLNSIWR